MMLVKDFHRWLQTLADIDLETTVDRIIIGDPDAPVDRVAVCWQSYWETLKNANAMGIRVVVTHEPTFYTHYDLRETNQPYPDQTAIKKKWIEDNRMTVIRCHDALDKAAEFGIPFAFGRGLGLNKIIRSQQFYNVYEIQPAKALDVAKSLAGKLRAVNQLGIAFYGDKDRIIKTIGVGTGCGCNPREFSRMAPDLFIAIDDSIRTWTETSYSKDTGVPLVVINHGASEEFGVIALRDKIADAHPEIDAIHFPQGCGYDWVTG